MKIAVSNIAWRIDEEAKIAELLVRKKITGVEVAPAKIAPDPSDIGEARIQSYRDFWNSQGISIVAMQGLLFGQSHLRIFTSSQSRKETLQYLRKIVVLGGKLGAATLVFGSPQNRKRNDLSLAEAESIAVSFFRALGDVAAEVGTCLCIEANPASYGCDFVTTTREAYELVQKVDHVGFGLHVDAASLAAAGETAADLVGYGVSIRHFHASEPDLQPVVGTASVDHPRYADGLKRIGYTNWVSIEMKTPNATGDNAVVVEQAIDFVQTTYA